MKKCFYILAATIFLFSCGAKKTDSSVQNNNADTTNTVADTAVSFFPVTSFIQGQMIQFDSMAITPLLISTVHDKADSQWIKREQLRPLLQSFLTPVINETNLVKYFKETKFNDQTVGAITLTYDPITTLPDSISLSNWNVYIDPKKGTVNKVYIVKHITENGQSIIQQLIWQTGEFAQITEILNKPDGSFEIIRQDKYIWNFD
jgi:hypothetical protein